MAMAFDESIEQAAHAASAMWRGEPPAGMQPDWLFVHGMNLDAQGVARRDDGKVVFIDGALPQEWVSASPYRKKNSWEAATLTHIHHASAQRVSQPRCPSFGLHAGACGGCKMQHIQPATQVALKQKVLEDNLWHMARTRAQQILAPIHGPDWGYRWRARLSVRYVHKKGQVLIGFHERKSRYIADMPSCAILPAHVSAMLLPLRELIASLDARDTCPQIELACGEEVTALVLRHLEPLGDADIARLHAFAAQHSGVQWWLQPKGPDSIHCISSDTPQLAYRLPEFGITMPFRPTDFTQVNPHINRVLVERALRWLDAQPTERVIDWFCGLGNFTLPIATRAGDVLGVEGSETLVARARANYQHNNPNAYGQALAPTRFVARNLFEMTPAMLVQDGQADKWLVDPPREGAFALVKALADLHQCRLHSAHGAATGGQSVTTHPNNCGGVYGSTHRILGEDMGIGHVGKASAPHDSHAQAAAALASAPDWQPPRRIVYVSCNPATLARDAGLLVHQAGYVLRAAGVVNMFPHTAHVESLAVFERVDSTEMP